DFHLAAPVAEQKLLVPREQVASTALARPLRDRRQEVREGRALHAERSRRRRAAKVGVRSALRNLVPHRYVTELFAKHGRRPRAHRRPVLDGALDDDGRLGAVELAEQRFRCFFSDSLDRNDDGRPRHARSLAWISGERRTRKGPLASSTRSQSERGLLPEVTERLQPKSSGRSPVTSPREVTGAPAACMQLTRQRAGWTPSVGM